MVVKLAIFMICTLSMSLTVCSQDIKELKQIESDTEYRELYEKTAPIIEADTNAAIKIFEDAFYKADNNLSKAGLLHELGALYSTPEQIEKYFGMCEGLINSGVSVFFQIRDRTYPTYTKSFENDERYTALLKQNNELVKKEKENSKAEYYIQKPNNYDENKRYPLLMVFHGGVGSIQSVNHYWQAPILNENYIVAYVQGRNFKCSSKRRFGQNGKTDIKNIFNKIREDYLIDTSKVILGGPSAGGMVSIDLAINNHISVQGLILAFPVKPREFGADEIYTAGLNGLRVSMICGENDWAIERQKEMSVIFDKMAVANKIVIFPDIGHEYPDDFSNQIKKSIDYIGNN